MEKLRLFINKELLFNKMDTMRIANILRTAKLPVDISLIEAEFLWKKYSKKQGVEWQVLPTDDYFLLTTIVNYLENSEDFILS